ncbi:MAG: GNAT family N-acetyltransferase [Thiolinea sp.]
MADIVLRPATPDDLGLLRYWDEQPHVKAAIGSDESDWQWESELQRSPEWREFLIAELSGRPIGFIQIIDPLLEDAHYWGEVEPNLRALDIWIGEPDALGKGYGTQMMQMAFGRCFSDPAVTAILIDPLASNKRALRFYERLGFKFVEERRFDEELCRVYQLRRETWMTD